MNAILVALSKTKYVRAWKNPTGVAQSMDGERTISFGLRGSSDIVGIIAPCGIFLAVEVKTGNARQSKYQKNFAAMIQRHGGSYIVARSVEDALLEVEAVWKLQDGWQELD